MPEIEKIMNIATGDIEKLMNIAGDDIEKVMNIDYPVSAVWTGTRGIYGGGTTGLSFFDVIDYKTISSTGAMSDFGDLDHNKYYISGTSNGTRGVFMAGVGYDAGNVWFNNIRYITIASTGDTTDAGDLTQTKLDTVSASNGTNAFVFGGTDGSGSWNDLDEIDYVAIASTSNASDFGDISTGPIDIQGGAINDATRALRYKGAARTGSIYTLKYCDYITMATTGDTSDFGDMTETGIQGMGGASNTTRGINFGGRASASASSNVIDYVTVASTGDASDFGDLSVALDNQASGTSSVSNLTKAEVYGGNTTGGDGMQDNIDYVTIASTGNATSAGDDMTAAKASGAAFSGT